jgi:hypothetical protein
MKDRGVVKNFEEGRSNKVRTWKGIGLRGSVTDPSPNGRSVTPQKSCKQGGGETSEGQITPNSENFSEDTPRVERFSENGQDLSLLSPNPSDTVTTPLSWEEDGMEIEYMPEGE